MSDGTSDGTSDRTEPGPETDVRFTYANERTFLAWNRTSLALIAAGLAVVSFLPEFKWSWGARAVGVPLIALGALLSFTSFRRWEANEAAMRLGAPLPASNLPKLLAIGIALASAVAAIVALVGTAE